MEDGWTDRPHFMDWKSFSVKRFGEIEVEAEAASSTASASAEVLVISSR